MSDPYMLDAKEAGEKTREEARGGSRGVICPQKNPAIGGTCKVCEEVQRLFNTKEKNDREIALQKMAKCNFYANVVFPSDPGNPVILEMGKKVGNDILDKITAGKWLDIAHPSAGVGRELEITKKKGDLGFNTYDVSPSLDHADYDVPEGAVKARRDLDRIVDLLETEEIFRVSSLKMDETLTFRLLPPWENAQGDNRRVINYVYRHWGVTQGEVDGSVPLSFPTGAEDAGDDIPFGEPVQQEEGKSKRDVCFGDPDFFDPDDKEVCGACDDFRACKKDVLTKQAA